MAELVVGGGADDLIRGCGGQPRDRAGPRPTGRQLGRAAGGPAGEFCLPRQRSRPPTGHCRDGPPIREPPPPGCMPAARSSAPCRSWRGVTGTWLLLGGFPERGREHEQKKIRNSAVLLDPSGAVISVYRKMHLFDVDVPGGRRFRESEAIEPGDAPVVAETPWGGLGLSICYDLRFPELYRALAARGARILAVPSAFTVETGEGPLARAPPRAGRREPGLRRGAGAVRGAWPNPQQLRARPGGRPLGRRARRVRRPRGGRPRPPRLRLSGSGSAPRSPR